MKKRIVVAGAGHGGLVAAYYLALAGYNVTVYERQAEGTLGYEQSDSVHLDGFEEAGIPVPEKYRVKRTPLSFIIPGTDLPPLTLGVHDDSYNVEIDRKALYDLLLGLAEEAGATVLYGVTVEGPIMLGSRVAGIRTSSGCVYADLVIDACGLSSPVRKNLPEFTLTDKEAARPDMLTAYRAYFDRVPDTEDPAQKYKVDLIPGETAGLMWTIGHPDNVDVLIGAFSDLTREQIEEKLSYLRSVNPQLGQTLLKGGDCHLIPLRQPMAVLVADGYAAIGDAAFMTIPIKGSGVGYSMRAGKILAKCVIEDEQGLFNRETLWSYQCAFFDEVGFDGGLLAIIKNLIPVITQEDIEYVFSAGILSPEMLQKFGNEEGMAKVLSSLTFGNARDLAKKVVGHQRLRRIILSTAKNLARYAMVRQNLREKYESRNVEKWAASYNRFFANLSEPKTDDADMDDPVSLEPAE